MTHPVNTVLDPHLTECARCPGWQIACATEAEKQRREERHAHHKHGDPMPEQSELPAGAWDVQAGEAVRQVAARGKDFRIYDALAEFGLQSPPDAQHKIGAFAVRAHDLQIAHPVRDEASTRPGTNRSAAGVWNRDVRRCRDLKCRRKAGVA